MCEYISKLSNPLAMKEKLLSLCYSSQEIQQFIEFFEYYWGFSGGSDGKESTCNVGDLGLITVLRRSPGEGNGYTSSVHAWRIPWTEESGRL